MEQMVNDRIKIILDYYGMSPNEIDRELGLYRGTTYNVLNGVNGKRSKPSHDYIVKVLKRFPDIDANWLMVEDGTMFKSDNTLKETQEENERLKAENNLLFSELQGSRFALSIVAKHSNFQQGNVAANFKVVSKKSPVNQQLIIKKTIVVNSLVNSVS